MLERGKRIKAKASRGIGSVVHTICTLGIVD